MTIMKRMNRVRRAAAVVAGSVMLLCSTVTVSAEGTFDISELKPLSIEVDLRQDDGHLYDANYTYMKTLGVRPPAVNALRGFPEKYDLRDEGKVTSVKNQFSWGTCWSFGALSAIESNAMMKEGAPNDIDLSEKALVWTSKGMLKEKNAPDSMLEGLSADTIPGGPSKKLVEKQYVYNSGGNDLSTSAVLASWRGASTEAKVPYKNTEYETGVSGNWSMPYRHVYDDEYRLKNASLALGAYLHIANGTYHTVEEVLEGAGINDMMKGWLMDNGVVTIAYCSDLLYYNKDTCAQYNPNSDDITDHEVSVVGWDDTYPKEKFKNKPPGNGAWIVKNSWGTGWGDQGYFYLSYYDATVYTIGTLETDMKDANGYFEHDNNYQYDYMGLRSNVGSSAEYTIYEKNRDKLRHISTANVFKAKGDETLRAVGIADNFTCGETLDVKLEVYKLKDNKSPVDGELVSAQSERIDNFLYPIIDLEKPVELKEDEYFSVVQTLTSDLEIDSAPILNLEFGTEKPIEVKNSNGQPVYTLKNTVVCEPGRSISTSARRRYL